MNIDIKSLSSITFNGNELEILKFNGITVWQRVKPSSNNIVYYTSTDGNIVTPNPSAIFNANLIDNTYEDGQGTMIFDADVTIFCGRAFMNNQTIKTVDIPSGVTYICNEVFKDCVNLESVVIPNTVTNIGDSAFLGCEALREVHIPKSVVNINTSAFQWCSSLHDIYYDGTEAEWNDVFKGNHAFDNISTDAIFHFKEIPNNEIWYTSTDNKIVKPYNSDLGKVVSNTYIDGKGVMTFENDLTVIVQQAFSAQYNLETIILPSTITKIEYSAFNVCKALTSVTIPNSVTKIDEQAFYLCSGLTSVDIPSGVTIIKNATFDRCSGLTSVTISSGVTEIEGYAFNDCGNLTSITYNGTKAQWNAITKDRLWKKNVPSTCVVHCTDGDISI